jgi:hypothetical protein
MTRRVQVLWVPAVASILAAEMLLLVLTAVATLIDLVVDVGGGRHAAEHTFCGTAWVLVSFVLAPAVALVVGLLAAVLWDRRAALGSSTGHPSTARA